MSEIVNQSLQKIVKGTGIVFFGTIIGMFLGFVSRVIVIRYITLSEYGVFSLAVTLSSIFGTIAALGLPEGVARYIAYFRGKGEERKVKSTISSSIKISLITSIIFSLALFLLADTIAIDIYHTQELSKPLKVFSAAIPFTVLIGIFTSIFRGFDDVRPNVYFQNILRGSLYILFLIVVIFLGLSFSGVIYAYFMSIVITCVAFAVYFIKKLSFSVKESNADSMWKELLSFSIPLLIVAILGMIMGYTDTLMLGYFKTPDVVGLYNGALPLAQLITVILVSSGFIYTPIVSGLYSKGLIEEIGRTYQILTKWIFSVTFPVFLVIFLFPETVLNFFYGSSYVQAAQALRILALGFMFHTFLGLNGLTLVVMGKTRFLMFTSFLAAASNVVLNYLLIPSFGMIGAAFASFLSYCVGNIIVSAKLYRISKIHPFTVNNAKMVVAGIVLLALIRFSTSFLKIEFWMLFPILLLYLLAYGFLILLTKSFDREDIELLLAIERRMGVDLSLVKRILKKFV